MLSLCCSEFGGLNPELSSITQVAWLSIFVGAIYGGINNSKEAYLDFIKNNQATAFSNHMDAKASINYKIYNSHYMLIKLFHILKSLLKLL